MKKKAGADDSEELGPLDGLIVTLLAVCTQNLRMISHGEGPAVLWCLILRESEKVVGALEKIGILGLGQSNEPQEWLA